VVLIAGVGTTISFGEVKSGGHRICRDSFVAPVSSRYAQSECALAGGLLPAAAVRIGEQIDVRFANAFT